MPLCLTSQNRVRVYLSSSREVKWRLREETGVVISLGVMPEIIHPKCVFCNVGCSFDCLIWPAQMSLQKHSALIRISTLAGTLKLGKLASFMCFGTDTLCMGIKYCGKFWVILGSTKQSSFSVKLLKRDLTQMLITLLTRITPFMTPATAMSRDRSLSLIRLAKSWVIKFSCELLSSSARHVWIWLSESYMFTMAVKSKTLKERWRCARCIVWKPEVKNR